MRGCAGGRGKEENRRERSKIIDKWRIKSINYIQSETALDRTRKQDNALSLVPKEEVNTKKRKLTRDKRDTKKTQRDTEKTDEEQRCAEKESRAQKGSREENTKEK